MGKALPIVGQTGVLGADGRRTFVVPADVSGRFTRLRRVVFALLIGIYAALPWVEVGGHPAIFLDIERRAFYLFGAAFNAQDFWLVFFLLSGAGFSLILVTALWGRIWCGYACPQTVFLEGVYRRVERWIEGPRNLRKSRDAGGLTLSKALRKVLKHAAFIAISIVVAHIFLSYFVSLPALFRMVRANPSEHPEAFAWATALTGIMYFNFAWFREQFCIFLCPYGRLQSVLTDADTVVIGYDTHRGEPRGKAKAAEAGDCVDCGRCVVVCPTGIDIRNGLQLECVGCAACVDACDDVMARLGRSPGLVRYDSLNGLLRRSSRVLRPRLYIYAALGLLGLVAATFALSHRTQFEANLLRLPGAPYALEGDRVRNMLELHLVNKRATPATFTLSPVQDGSLEYVIAQPRITLPSMGSRRIPIFATAPDDRRRRQVSLRIDDGQAPRLIALPFVAPR